MDNDKKQNSIKLKNLNWLLYIAIGLFIITIGIYFVNFNNGFSPDRSDWGTFGDFMGGTLNPLFAFLSLFAIIYTIRVQTQELEYSRKELIATKEELEKSRIAQEEQSKSFIIQNASIERQTFENTFFQLVNSLTNTRDNIILDIRVHPHFNECTLNDMPYKKNEFGLRKDQKLQSYEAIKMYLKMLKLNEETITSKIYDNFNTKFEGYTGAYFGQIYQILKFIKGSHISNQQDYINLFRAQFTKEELEFLFYHCLGEIGSRKFKLLVEEFQFFEHISPNEFIYNNINLYAINAFGENKTIIAYLDDEARQ